MLESRRRRRPQRRHHPLALLGVAALGGAAACSVATPVSGHRSAGSTVTPVRHLVVLFQENVSFDHYFGTYPHAADTDGHPFHAARHTPKVNGLSGALLTNNPNGANPSRLSPSQALTCDQNHGYTAEQKAFDGGRMDKFIPFTGNESCSPPEANPPNLVMDYFD